MSVAVQGACITMPPSGLIDPSGKALQRKNAPSKRKSSGAPTGFTFVDQSADLRSIADKKIVDSDQRHLIRSHVMQKVRKDERLLGKKRPTGRDGPRKGSSSNTAVSTPQSDSLSASTLQLDSGSSSPVGSISPTRSTSSLQLAHIPPSPSQGRVDPFNTLPGGNELGKLTNNLVKYCFYTFIPMTFPIESNSPRQYDTWRLKILQSQSANSATFFGMMAIVAAHQAINSGRHRDLKPSPAHERPNDLLLDNDFAVMKSQALKATQARITQNGWDGPTVEAIFSLIGAEEMLGNFEEAHFHLSALRKFFVNDEDLEPIGPISNWIPLTDVKGAIGTMSKPLFRLPWDTEVIPQDLLNKVYDWHAPEISLLGTSFSYVDELGSQLQTFSQEATVLCRFCQFIALRGSDLTGKEYDIFRRKSLELEHGILSYIYPGSPSDERQTVTSVNCVEQIARLAILGITSSVITKLHPSAGVGRALTHFQTLAIQDFIASTKKMPAQSTARFVVWALMVFAQCASKQPEERHFINNIAWASQLAGINNWMSLEIVCASFLYVPAFHQSSWQQTWNKACQLLDADKESRIVLPSRSQPDNTVLRSQSNRTYP